MNAGFAGLVLGLSLALAVTPVPAQIIIPTGYTLTISPFPLHGRVTSSPGTINCGSSFSPVGTVCAGNFLGTTTVTLTATPDTGYVFLRWTGGLGTPTSNPYSFSMPSSALTMAPVFATVPSAPGIGAATPGNAQATIAFTPSASDGGSPITGYRATCNPGNHWTSKISSPITVTGLTNGTAYTCSVTATNAAGTSPASGTVSVTPRTVPDAPTIRYVDDLVVGRVDFRVLTASDGGSPITAVNFSCNPGGHAASGTPDVTPGTWKATFTTLSTGVDYSCFANAVNAAGMSSASAMVNLRPAANIVITSPALPAGIVGLPYSHTFTATGGCGSISWRYYDSNPWAAIPGLSLNPSTGALNGTPTTPTTPVGPGQATPVWYRPMFIAESSTPNPDTVTVYCSRSKPFGYDITIATVPGAPAIGAAVPGDGRATISFTPPAWNGGLPIANYLVTCSPGGIMAPGTASPITVIGLANGTRYSCSVTAMNDAGTGPASSSVDVTPAPSAGGAVFPMTVNSSIGSTATVSVVIWPRPQDQGKVWNVYVFAIAPSNRVQPAAADSFTLGKSIPTDGDKAGSVACVLAQLNASGQLRAVSISSLQAYVTGVLTSAGQAVTVVNGVATANIAGATFYVGYGTSPTDMIVTGMNRSVVSVPSDQICQPQPPQTGWWWNAAEDGRGYTIESTGSKLFFAAYLYDVSGRSTWYIAAGPTSLDGSIFIGDLESYTNGQTLTGPFRPPVRPPVLNGQITLAFNDAHHGTLTWPGGTVPISRMEFGVGGVNAVPLPNQPESGWWLSGLDDGRGFFIEWQAGIGFMAGFMYDESGAPVWYIAAKTTPDNPQMFASQWEKYVNGQTLTGAYHPPVRPPTYVGAATIQFNGAADAIMTMPGGRQVTLSRYRF